MTDVSYTLFVDGEPAGPELLAAVQEIAVEDHADLADMLRLRLSTAVRDSGDGWRHLDDGLFPRLARLRVDVTVGSANARTLIVAHVIETRTEFSNTPGESVLEVVAMDPTVLMNLEERVRPWPNMSDSDVARVVFSEYGFDCEVEASSPPRSEVDFLPMQRGTDILFLQELAARNGYEVFVESRSDGSVCGHFHPPRLQTAPQGVLSVNFGTQTNVNTFQARHDMLGPTTAEVTGLDVESHDEQPAGARDAGQEELGGSSALAAERPRRVLVNGAGLDRAGELQTLAQAVVDRSSWAIHAQGDLNTVTYGDVLRAKEPVLVRGAGSSFSGTYYVERVLHVLSGEGYVQQFSLRRNALGQTKREDFAQDDALPARGGA